MKPALFESSAPEPSLSELENEVIAFFVDLVRWFGSPKSLGAIYGLLFVSEHPVSFEQIATRLQISKGSVSQGLKILKDLGAVKASFQVGERRDFFIAETQLRKLAGGFFRHRLDPQLAGSEARLNTLIREEGFIGLSISPFIKERLSILERWQTQAKGILPLLLASLETDPAETGKV